MVAKTIYCLDFDSTVITSEGLDDFANFLGVGKEVEELTKSAMGGKMSFFECLKKRMEIMKITKKSLFEFLNVYDPKITPGVQKFIERVRKNGSEVKIISGGFADFIFLTAFKLEIPTKDIYCNYFKFDGKYATPCEGLDINCERGKCKIIDKIRQENGGYSGCEIVMIGDGSTDLETQGVANEFIGFGGNVIRENVKNRAHKYVYSFDEI